MNKKMKDVGPVFELQRMVKTIVTGLVDNHQAVDVTAKTGDSDQSRTVLIHIKTAQEDVGKVIGKRGRTVSSLRNIMNAAAAKFRKNVIIELYEYE